jgi:hypothetical protein
VPTPLGQSGLHRQDRRSAVQGLDLGFLVHAQGATALADSQRCRPPPLGGHPRGHRDGLEQQQGTLHLVIGECVNQPVPLLFRGHAAGTPD